MSGVQEYRSTGVQEFRSTGVQEFRSRGDNGSPEMVVSALLCGDHHLFNKLLTCMSSIQFQDEAMEAPCSCPPVLLSSCPPVLLNS
jgi:hypothetical protein